MSDVQVRSPVECLLRNIAGAPSAVAPERTEELRQLMTQLDVTIDFHWEDDGRPLCVQHDTRTIRFYLPLAERLWACCFGYTQLLSYLDSMAPGIVDLGASPIIDAARRFLSWAYFGGTSEWPNGLPRPTENPHEDAARFEATEAFLCMCGWMLLHEIGHVACGHGNSSPRTNEVFERREYEADDFASCWMLERWREYSQDERVFVKRSLGGLFALSILATHEVYDRTYGGFTHPDPVERLRHYLHKFCPEGDGPEPAMTDPAWFVSVVILQLHLDQVGKSIPARAYDSFEETMNAAERELNRKS